MTHLTPTQKAALTLIRDERATVHPGNAGAIIRSGGVPIKKISDGTFQSIRIWLVVAERGLHRPFVFRDGAEITDEWYEAEMARRAEAHRNAAAELERIQQEQDDASAAKLEAFIKAFIPEAQVDRDKSGPRSLRINLGDDYYTVTNGSEYD